MPTIVFSNKDTFDKKLYKLITDGPDHLHIVADFDMTLTTATSTTCYGVLRGSSLLSAEYKELSNALFTKYRPIEIDPSIPKPAKIAAMEEWWRLSNMCLVNEGIKIDDIMAMVAESAVAMRKRSTELFQLLEASGIPIIIFSAGIKAVIDDVLVFKEGRIYDGMHVISNEVVTDEDGTIVSVVAPIIHVLNKNEHAAERSEWFKDVANHRKNGVRIGDSLGDADMVDAVDDTVIRIGFLNGHVNQLDNFKKAFDVVILDDCESLDYVLRLIQMIVN